MLRRFAAFPLRSGELTIGPMTVAIDRSSLMDLFGPGRARGALQRTGVPVVLEVQALPEQDRPGPNVAVGSFQLDAKLDRTQVVTGDAVTLTATLSGTGNLSGLQLPTPQVPGLEVLQPQTRELVEVKDDLVKGTRVFEWLIVAKEGREFTIPPIGIDTFDPSAGAYRRVESPPLGLTAAGSAPTVAATEPQPDEAPRPEATESTAEQAEWPPIHTQSALDRGQARLLQRSFYPWVLGAAPALWLLVVAATFVRRGIQRNLQGGGPQQALRLARKKLETAAAQVEGDSEADFQGTLVAALTGALEARLQEPLGGLTHGELRALLAERGMADELVDEVVAQLQNCDFARFGAGGVDVAARRDQLSQVQQLFGRLETFRPTPKQEAA